MASLLAIRSGWTFERCPLGWTATSSEHERGDLGDVAMGPVHFSGAVLAEVIEQIDDFERDLRDAKTRGWIDEARECLELYEEATARMIERYVLAPIDLESLQEIRRLARRILQAPEDPA